MTRTLTRITVGLTVALAMGASVAGETTPARSETVAGINSYRAPSGMFFEGTAKAEHYQFFQAGLGRWLWKTHCRPASYADGRGC
jgi:hypothetical protein